MSDPLKLETITAFLAIDHDGNEGICAIGTVGLEGERLTPMVCADQRRVEQMRPIARDIARKTGTRIVVAVFSVRTDIEEIDP